MKLRSILTAIALCLSGSAINVAHGAAISFTSVTGNFIDGNNRNVGWEFTPVVDLTVTGLGFYDDGANGLAQEHPVGIYSLGGNLLVSGTVASGTAGTLDGLFRYVNVASTALQAGTTYVIGTLLLGSGDGWVWNGGVAGVDILDLVVNSAITIGAPGTGRYNCCGENVLAFPASSIGDNRFVFTGPNFQFETGLTETPIPGALPLFASGLGAIGLMAWRRKRKVNA